MAPVNQRRAGDTRVAGVASAVGFAVVAGHVVRRFLRSPEKPVARATRTTPVSTSHRRAPSRSVHSARISAAMPAPKPTASRYEAPPPPPLDDDPASLEE